MTNCSFIISRLSRCARVSGVVMNSYCVGTQEESQYIPPITQEAQRCGLTHELTRWVCNQVAHDYAFWFRGCEELYITINLSLCDLSDDSFAEIVFCLAL